MRWPALVLLAAAAACSSLPDAGGGVVALEIRSPASLTLKIGHADTLHARALNLNGDSVAADIIWRTPDGANVALDTARGIVTALKATGTARIQAQTGTLLSDILVLTLQDTTGSSTLRQRP